MGEASYSSSSPSTLSECFTAHLPFLGLLSRCARTSLSPQQPSLCPSPRGFPRRLDPFPPSSPWASFPGSVPSLLFLPLITLSQSDAYPILDQRPQRVPMRSPPSLLAEPKFPGSVSPPAPTSAAPDNTCTRLISVFPRISA